MKKRILPLLLAFMLAFCLAIPASAAFECPADTGYWHNLSVADADELLQAMVEGSAAESHILLYYSFASDNCSTYVPQIAEFANQEGIHISGFGETPDPDTGLVTKPTLHFWEATDGNSIYFPCAFTYNAQTEQYSYQDKLTLDSFKAYLDEQGLLEPAPPAPPSTFTDVPADKYYADPVAWAVENDITKGTSSTTFSPRNPCTRAQIVTFLWRASGRPGHTIENPFSDVSPEMGGDFYNAILWAVENDITNGTTPATFSPSKTCTRAQAVTFLWRSKDKPEHWADNPFYDVGPSMLADFRSAILWAAENGVAQGTDGFFNPNKTCSRGDIVTFLYRAYK